MLLGENVNLQHIDYRYNIRGWLRTINDTDLNPNGGEKNPLFGMELVYNTPLSGISTPQYNGNISALKWSSYGMEEERLYHFDYDPLNCLKEAHYRSGASGAWAGKIGHFNEQLSYDYNGNITTLNRTQKGTLIDRLEYSYAGKGNQLQSVTDLEHHPEGFKDGNTRGPDYAYDANGNMVEDKNKEIANILYNYLNLPQRVLWTSERYIDYQYDAAGIKLAQVVYDSGKVVRTDYLGEFNYKNDTLQFVHHEEGRLLPANGQWEYQYHLKDLLGKWQRRTHRLYTKAVCAPDI